jgi:hypothetical protein
MTLRRIFTCAALVCLTLTGCDLVMQKLNRPAADGQAIGAACRHTGRALEDCYTLNPRIGRADIYAGWRDMDTYMRKNKIAEVPAVVPVPLPPTAGAAPLPDEEGEAQNEAKGSAGHGKAKAEGKEEAKSSPKDKQAEPSETLKP